VLGGDGVEAVTPAGADQHQAGRVGPGGRQDVERLALAAGEPAAGRRLRQRAVQRLALEHDPRQRGLRGDRGGSGDELDLHGNSLVGFDGPASRGRRPAVV
jgi:hypothetical protein